MTITTGTKGTKCTSKCRAPSEAQAHCSICHETFASVSLFDEHHRDFKIVGRNQSYRGTCLKPKVLKLVKVYDVWDTKAHASVVRRRVEAMHKARSEGSV